MKFVSCLLAGSSTQSSPGTLFDHLTQPEFQMRLRWAPGTVAIWDNRCTQHYVSLDYLPSWRRMHRVTLVNDRRVDAQGGVSRI